jgi:hypothetical protein
MRRCPLSDIAILSLLALSILSLTLIGG